MNPLYIVQSVNSLLQLLSAIGMTWNQVGDAIAKAKAEGREFGLQDIEQFKNDAAKKLAALDQAIADAKNQAAPAVAVP